MTTPRSQEHLPNQQWPAAHEEEEMPLSGYVRVLLSYWWIVLPLVILGGALGVAFAKIMPPEYRALCRFEIYENQWLHIREMENTDRGDGGTGNTAGIKRHIMLLRSTNLNQKVRKQLQESWAEKAPDIVPDPELQIERVKDAPDSMLDIHVDSFHPEYSREYIELLLHEYRGLRLQEAQLVWEDTKVNLTAEREKLAAEWDAARMAVTEFEAKHNLIFASKKEVSDLNYLSEILDKSRAVRTQRTILESQFPFITDANAATLRDVLDLTVFSTQGSSSQPGNEESRGSDAPGWSEMPEWHSGEARVIGLKEEYEHMRTLYKAEHPKMIALQQEIDTAERGLQTSAKLTLKRLQSRRDALKMQEDALEEAARSIRTSMNMSVQEKAQYENLKSRADYLQSMLDRVYTRILDSTSGPPDSTFSRTVEGPKALAEPVWPQPLKSLAVGSLLGLIFGISGVFLLHFRRQRLYNVERMERTIGLGALAWIPKISRAHLDKEPFYVTTLPKHDVICESYRSLRTVLEEKLGDGQVLMLTSSDRSEGKTFTSANIAAVFGWRYKRVLLIDADFRKVTLSERLLKDGGSGQGLIDCLEDPRQDWRPLVQHGLSENLDVLPAGKSSNRASELLQGQRIEQILGEMRSEYDIIIIDSSPVNLVVDATILSRYVDAVGIVMVPGVTKIPALRYAVNRLQSANIIGYIANSVTSGSRMYYTYYGDSAQYSTYGYYGQPPAKYASYAARENSASKNGKVRDKVKS